MTSEEATAIVTDIVRALGKNPNFAATREQWEAIDLFVGPDPAMNGAARSDAVPTM